MVEVAAMCTGYRCREGGLTARARAPVGLASRGPRTPPVGSERAEHDPPVRRTRQPAAADPPERAAPPRAVRGHARPPGGRRPGRRPGRVRPHGGGRPRRVMAAVPVLAAPERARAADARRRRPARRGPGRGPALPAPLTRQMRRILTIILICEQTAGMTPARLLTARLVAALAAASVVLTGCAAADSASPGTAALPLVAS